jgi:hypothetical protein
VLLWHGSESGWVDFDYGAGDLELSDLSDEGDWSSMLIEEIVRYQQPSFEIICFC